jgi:hypothetical protein
VWDRFYLSPSPLLISRWGRVFDRTARGNRASPGFSSCPTWLLAVNQLFRKLY